MDKTPKEFPANAMGSDALEWEETYIIFCCRWQIDVAFLIGLYYSTRSIFTTKKIRKNQLNGKFTSIQMEKVHSHGGWKEIECTGGSK